MFRSLSFAALLCAGLGGLLSTAAAASRADTSRVRLAHGDAFVAWPAGDDPAPAVIIAHEWWGLNGQIREVARRFAHQGYVAIVPDFYKGRVAGNPEQAHVLVRGVGPEAVTTLSSAVKWLRSQPRTRNAAIGVVGFCVGGSLAQEVAMANPEIRATVVFYGGPERDYLTRAAARAPLQGHYGATDDGIPVRDVEAFREALRRQGGPHEIYVYTGAGHAFMHEGRESHHADAARQAWSRTFAFLQKHLR